MGTVDQKVYIRRGTCPLNGGMVYREEGRLSRLLLRKNVAGLYIHGH